MRESRNELMSASRMGKRSKSELMIWSRMTKI